MRGQCPKCRSFRLARVGQYSKFMRWGLGGCAILIVAAIVLPVFWLALPIWWISSLYLYLTRPLLACEDCEHLWNPRKPEAVIQVEKTG